MSAHPTDAIAARVTAAIREVYDMGRRDVVRDFAAQLASAPTQRAPRAERGSTIMAIWTLLLGNGAMRVPEIHQAIGGSVQTIYSVLSRGTKDGHFRRNDLRQYEATEKAP